FTRGNGCSSRHSELYRHAFQADLFDIRKAVNDLQIDDKRFVWRLAETEFAGSGKRPPLDASEQLLDVQTRDGSLAAQQVGGPVQSFGKVINAGAGAFDR